MKAAWSQSMLGKLDMGQFQKSVSPEVIMRAQKDPNFYKMIKEIEADPSPATMAKWIDDPNIGPLVGQMWKTMQGS